MSRRSKTILIGVLAAALALAVAIPAFAATGGPATDLPHIFERFYRVDKSRSSAGGGSGIGLAVAKTLVEQMGGSISAESVPGTYTRITFRLPSSN